MDIKLLILDVDGVLSDGRIIYNNNYIESKFFSARDGLGIRFAQLAGIEIAIITGRESNCVAQRARDLKIKEVHQAIHEKLAVAEDVIKRLGITWDNVAYVGDDWNDYPVMQKAAFSACPADTTEDFQKTADYVCKLKGGKGAVREAIEIILKDMNLYEKTIQNFISSIS